jgi:hypothetical protein
VSTTKLIIGDIEVMFGQTTLGAGSVSSSASRVFRYEVVGLKQNQETDKNLSLIHI